MSTQAVEVTPEEQQQIEQLQKLLRAVNMRHVVLPARANAVRAEIRNMEKPWRDQVKELNKPLKEYNATFTALTDTSPDTDFKKYVLLIRAQKAKIKAVKDEAAAATLQQRNQLQAIRAQFKEYDQLIPQLMIQKFIHDLLGDEAVEPVAQATEGATETDETDEDDAAETEDDQDAS